MNVMHSVCIHVIRKAAAAADPGNDHNIFSWNPQSGHDLLNLCQNGIISATGAPAYFLIGSKIFRGKNRLRGSCCFAHNNKFSTKLAFMRQCMFCAALCRRIPVCQRTKPFVYYSADYLLSFRTFNCQNHCT